MTESEFRCSVDAIIDRFKHMERVDETADIAARLRADPALATARRFERADIADENERMAEIEEQARAEIIANDDRFHDWVAQFHDTTTLARLLSILVRGQAEGNYHPMMVYRDQLVKDYIDFRIEAMQ